MSYIYVYACTPFIQNYNILNVIQILFRYNTHICIYVQCHTCVCTYAHTQCSAHVGRYWSDLTTTQMNNHLSDNTYTG